MSLFKVKQWWSTNKWQEKTPNVGVVSPNCVKVDKFNSHTDSDCIIIGEDLTLKIYKPSLDQDVSDILLETELSDIVVHIETGKFIGEPAGRQIIVLHPLCYSVYQLEKKEGHTNAGDQNILNLMIKHTFTRKAHCLTCGPFGNIKTRDLICVQGLDGSLSFFDQDTFLFMCIFNDVIIPGPVCYVASCDSFVIAKSTWILEIYSYQQLREFSEINLRQNKKNIPQWVYNTGEEIASAQVIQTSTNFSTIVALGERHLYCFQDNGLMKYMIKFDYMPICFCAYLIGWYYEPTSRLLVMVASEDSKLYIYESTTLLWSCDLIDTAISITRCFLKSLSGGLVTLSSSGIVTINFLGTEPDLNSNAAPVMNEVVNPEFVQKELEAVEEELQTILEHNGEQGNQLTGVLQTLKIKADVGKPTQNLFQESLDQNQESLQLKCPVFVMMSSEDPQLIQNIQITYICSPPFVCSESAVFLDHVNGTEIIESQVFLTNKTDISDMKVEIIFTITDNMGKIIIITKKIVLPLSLYCTPTNVDTDKTVKLNVCTNQANVHFGKIISDFSEEELYSLGNSTDTLTLIYRSTKKIITLRAHEQYYSLEAEDFPEIAIILEYFIFKLTDHFTRMGVKDFKFYVRLNKELFKQITFRFLKSVEIHAKDRIKLKGLEAGNLSLFYYNNMCNPVLPKVVLNFLWDNARHYIITSSYGRAWSPETGIICLKGDLDAHKMYNFYMNELNILQKQFTIVQKRLLVQYGSLPPGDCDLLEFLMRDTHERLKNLVNEIMQCKENIYRAGKSLVTMGRLIIYILRHTALEPFKLKLVEEMLCLSSLYDDYQEWEESVTQSMSYIMNKVFKNTEKDKEKLAPVTEQGILSHIYLKRFIKQMRNIFDKLFAEVYEDGPETNETPKETKIIRTEEFVEVI